MRRSSLRDFTSTTETSFDAPLAGVGFCPAGIERDTPDRGFHGNRCRYVITLCIDDDYGVGAAS